MGSCYDRAQEYQEQHSGDLMTSAMRLEYWREELERSTRMYHGRLSVILLSLIMMVAGWEMSMQVSDSGWIFANLGVRIGICAAITITAIIVDDVDILAFGTKLINGWIDRRFAGQSYGVAICAVLTMAWIAIYGVIAFGALIFAWANFCLPLLIYCVVTGLKWLRRARTIRLVLGETD